MSFGRRRGGGRRHLTIQDYVNSLNENAAIPKTPVELDRDFHSPRIERTLWALAEAAWKAQIAAQTVHVMRRAHLLDYMGESSVKIPLNGEVRNVVGVDTYYGWEIANAVRQPADESFSYEDRILVLQDMRFAYSSGGDRIPRQPNVYGEIYVPLESLGHIAADLRLDHAGIYTELQALLPDGGRERT